MDKKSIEEAIEVLGSLLDTCYEGKTKDGKNNPVYCIGGVETTSKYYNYKEKLHTALEVLQAVKEGIAPEQLHKWYLEATKELDPHFFNLKAQVPYEELHEKQKSINKYIADKINEKSAGKIGKEIR